MDKKPEVQKNYLFPKITRVVTKEWPGRHSNTYLKTQSLHSSPHSCIKEVYSNNYASMIFSLWKETVFNENRLLI